MLSETPRVFDNGNVLPKLEDTPTRVRFLPGRTHFRRGDEALVLQMDRLRATRVTNWLEGTVTFFQTVIAASLVVLLGLGVLNLGITIVASLTTFGAADPSGIISLIRSAIDIVLYLFVVVELYKTIVAYVEAKSVVVAVIHAGLIAVVRQIIIFKPDDYSPTEAITLAGVYVLLLVALLVGFYVVHREIEDDEVE